ncbi:MAG: hypothetical protein WBC40_03715 [Halobacteriota archaeon]
MTINNDMSMEKIELNDLLKEMINEILGAEGSEKLKLRVEEVDAGIFVSPAVAIEFIKAPMYKEDVKENTGMLIDMKVREAVKGLLNRVMIKLHINERREVLIKNQGVHEVEILKSDLEGVKLREERERILKEKSHQISKAVKVAIERIMSGKTDS